MAKEFNDLEFLKDSACLAYYRLENVNDSKNSYTLTNVNSASFVAAKFGNGVSLNGSNQYLYSANAAFNLSEDAWAVSVWFKLNAVTANKQIIIMSRVTDGNTYGELFNIGIGDGGGTDKTSIIFQTWASSGSFLIINSGVGASVDTWYHVVGVKESDSSWKVYVNGVLGNSSTATRNRDTTGLNGIAIGAFDGGSQGIVNYANGIVDDAVVFKRALTPEEVSNIYYGIVEMDAYTKLLLHFEGADASTVIRDEMGKAVTAYGNAQLDTAQKKFGSSSLLLDGDGDYISVNDSDDFNFGAGNFTIDFWVRFANASGEQFFMTQYADNNNRFFIYKSSENKLSVGAVAGGSPAGEFYMSSAWSGLSADTWYHVAFVRNGSSCLMFIDGVSQAVTQSAAFGTMANIVANVDIGRYTSGAHQVNGWLDEFRVSKGIARWTANFTPPASAYGKRLELADFPLFGDANLASYYRLEGNSNDSKGSYHGTDTDITYAIANGKFNQGALFNGSSSKIDLPTNSGNHQAISVAFWIKTTQTSRGEVLTFGGSANNNSLFAALGRTTAGKIDLCIWNGSTTSVVTQLTAINDGKWHHIVLIRNGTSGIIYLDAIRDGAGTLHNTNLGNERWCFGYNRPGGGTPDYAGSLDDVAIFERVLTPTEITDLYYGLVDLITYTQTITAKAQVKQLSAAKTITSKAKIIQTATKAVTAKAMIQGLNIETIQAKADIKKFDVAKTVTAKALITNLNTKTAQAKSRVKKLGTTKTITVKAKIGGAVIKTIQAKAAVFHTYTKTITAKGRIKKTDIVKSITAKSRIKVLLTKTLQAKARIWAARLGATHGIRASKVQSGRRLVKSG